MSDEHYSLEAVLGYLNDPSRKSQYANGIMVRYDIYREIVYYLEKLEKNMAVTSSKKIEEIKTEEIVEEINGTEPVSNISDEDGQLVQEQQGQTVERTDGSERRSRRSNRRR